MVESYIMTAISKNPETCIFSVKQKKTIWLKTGNVRTFWQQQCLCHGQKCNGKKCKIGHEDPSEAIKDFYDHDVCAR